MTQIDTEITITSFESSRVPALPGVYLFISQKGKILYIGKAKNLRTRINQYIHKQDSRVQLPFLMGEAERIRVIVTRSEHEALILEAQLISKEHPPYNIDLLDEGRYPYIGITKEKWPRLLVIRRKGKGFRWLGGPFTDVGKLRKLITVLIETFSLRTCKRMPSKACINYQMGRCSAPCEQKITANEYEQNLTNVINLLKGKQWNRFSDRLKKEISISAENLHFEKAALLRDALDMLPVLRASLGIALNKDSARDIILFSFYSPIFVMSVARYSDGKLTQLFHFTDKYYDNTSSAITESLAAFYRNRELPGEISISSPETPWKDIAALFSPLKMVKRITKETLTLLRNNQQEAIGHWLRTRENSKKRLEELGKFIGRVPLSILCMDISTFGGEHTVAASVWWEDGKFIKKEYRRFRIKTIEGVDDFGSLREAVTRCAVHWDDGSWKKPHLFLVDGGKGQLSSIIPLIPAEITVAGIVKDRTKTRGHEILINQKGDELSLTNSSLALLVKAIRDEAHRFVITYNRNLRKDKTKSQLSTLKGIGKSREQSLLRYFGTFEAIRNATTDDIEKVSGISKELAKKIYDFFHFSGTIKS
ncbi:excinuclease ABC subunit UvrC [bacterium]|nr:excinuclease ABC subunit UvrC [bacterium]